MPRIVCYLLLDVSQDNDEGEVKYFLHNHLRFTILYHKDALTDLSRIVGFEVEPFSVKHSYEEWDDNNPTLNSCNPGRGVSVTHDVAPQPAQEGVEVVFTYDVRFTVSGTDLRNDLRDASVMNT